MQNAVGLRYRLPWSKGRVSSWSKALPSKPKRLLCGTLCQFCCFCLNLKLFSFSLKTFRASGPSDRRRSRSTETWDKRFEERKCRIFFLNPTSIITSMECSVIGFGEEVTSVFLSIAIILKSSGSVRSIAVSPIMDLNISNHVLYFYKYLIIFLRNGSQYFQSYSLLLKI